MTLNCYYKEYIFRIKMLFSANQNELHIIFFIEVFGVPGRYRYKNDVINNFAVVMSAVINKVDCNKEYS